jgi:retron-type reverse transcriptase
MFVPLTLERFVEDFLSGHPTWKHSDIWYHAHHPRYIKHEIPKKSKPASKRSILVDGQDVIAAEEPKMRQIHEPCPGLKVIHEYILDMILNPAVDCLLQCAHGCVPGKSTTTNAAPHVGCNLKIHMDLKDFFPTVTTKRVFGLFSKTFRYETKLSWLLANLCSYEGSLPQGAATSPMIANLIATSMDRRIIWLSNAVGCYYTRYVDDLTFGFRRWPSGGEIPRFIRTIRKIAKGHGFVVNEDKTSVITKKGRMVVTGVVVNSKTSIPIWFRRNLRAAIHQTKGGYGEDMNVILGKLAYIKGVCPVQYEAMMRYYRKMVPAQ